MFDHDHSHLPFHSHREPEKPSLLDPRGPILLAFAMILALLSAPQESLIAHGRLLAGVLVLVLALRVPIQDILRVALILSPWLLLLLLTQLFGAQASVTEGSERPLIASAMKALGSCLSLISLRHFLGTSSLIHGLARLGAPRLLLEATSLSLRMSELISDEAQRMNLARRARGDSKLWIWQAAELGPGVASLFLRSLARAERLEAAMRARAYDPKNGLFLSKQRFWLGQDSWLLATGLIVILGLRFGLPA